jgi:hypothetical protein
MDFVNETKVAAGWTMGFDVDGRELIVVAIKATFAIPELDGEPLLADEQVPLTESDRFAGEPGKSAVIYEVDFAHRKLACDVLVNATAYAPRGKAVTQLSAGVRVGGMTKTFAVIGDRQWRKGVMGITTTAPVPFSAMPISYERAFGGVDVSPDDPNAVKTFVENPVGRGFAYYQDQIDGRPLPNIEELGKRVEDPGGAYKPVALGPVGRSWRPRVRYAGTYDKAWMDRRAPFWPDDFDYRYFQAAPSDQQVPFPTGGEEVVLKNLAPAGDLAFKLPHLNMPTIAFLHDGTEKRLDTVIDTLVIEPDLGRFTMTWRGSLSMRRSCFDVRQIIAGDVTERSGRFVRGKPYFRNLEELAHARRAGRL